MLLLRHCRVCGTVGTRALSSARPLLNHYDTLGIEPDATSKQIKAAYYELSKKYHPDRHKNSDDKQSAAVKFQQVQHRIALQYYYFFQTDCIVTSAYEVLGSEEKRRVYDATIFANRVKDSYNITNQSTSTGQNVHYGQRRKMYTDLDIDYKNFEQFQRSTR
ncbi:unnamed protein product [Anisakis simplex]|uniref:DnaJ homolog subfamily A member 3, mitochondrial (inferred by orthology to a human protein) n=2 Tax=Anisakis simplex TaxID=6269 RepID=A0A0M3JBV5_ANISI|nr:unnamed protein product [Anisakis simplex]